MKTWICNHCCYGSIISPFISYVHYVSIDLSISLFKAHCLQYSFYFNCIHLGLHSNHLGFADISIQMEWNERLDFHVLSSLNWTTRSVRLTKINANMSHANLIMFFATVPNIQMFFFKNYFQPKFIEHFRKI